MVIERMPSVYETPRRCLPCGADFIPERKPGRPPSDYCTDRCRRAAHRRQLTALGVGVRDDVLPASPEQKIRPARPETILTKRPGRVLASGPKPTLAKVKQPQAIPPFGRAIAALRMQRGWLQSDLAERIGVHQNSILNWEVGKNEPPISKFALIANAFGVSLDDLWGGVVARDGLGRGEAAG